MKRNALPLGLRELFRGRSLEFFFEDPKLRCLCFRLPELEKRFGVECGGRIGLRISSLYAHHNLAAVQTGPPEHLRICRNGNVFECVVDAGPGVTIVFEPINKNANDRGQELEPSNVTAIRIKRIDREQ
jgi:hypothetical protein